MFMSLTDYVMSGSGVVFFIMSSCSGVVTSQSETMSRYVNAEKWCTKAKRNFREHFEYTISVYQFKIVMHNVYECLGHERFSIFCEFLGE